MAQDTKDALASLGPLDYSDLPAAAELPDFLRSLYRHAELLHNSVPSIFDSDAARPDHLAPPDSATSAKDTYLDASTIPQSYDPRQSTPELEKAWGKPLKISTKDNPLGVSIWKQAAHDRHSAWFARRSIHQGLSFERWKRCIQREFATSLQVTGGPGAGAVRGIAADRRLAKQVVPDVGTIEVWQLSSSFPGPTTPREFVSVMISSDDALSQESAPTGQDKPGRSFLSISRPSKHPDAPDRAGFVKGTYESTELIREINLYPDNPDMNPVEWLMITRSEPGGGIPKFLVERGTPGSIVADVPKWIDWAIEQGDLAPYDADEVDKIVDEMNKKAAESQPDDHRRSSSAAQIKSKASALLPGQIKPSDGASESLKESHSGGPTGYLAMIRDSVTETVSSYLPHFYPGHLDDDASIDSSDISDASSDRTFGTAVNDQAGRPGLTGSASELSKSTRELIKNELAVPSTQVELLLQEFESRDTRLDTRLTDSEKEFLKLADKRRQLDVRFATARREADEHAHKTAHDTPDDTPPSPDATKKAKEEATKSEKQTKEFAKQDARLKQDADKLEEKRAKLAAKIHERRRKAADKDEWRRLRAQLSDWKERTKAMERENEILRRQVEGLQRDNTVLVAHIDDEALVRGLLRDGGRSRAASVREAAGSGESGREAGREAGREGGRV